MVRGDSAGTAEVLAKLSVGIAGTGGIGSNVAMLLARAGAGSITAADFDIVEPSNLNRQFFFEDQKGMPKVEALRENLLRINSEIIFNPVPRRITADNINEIFGDCSVLVEAVDSSETKAMIIEQWVSLYPERPLIACSGLSGFDDFSGITVVRTGKLSVVGDQHSELEEGVFSAKVSAVASAMVMELLRSLTEGKCDNCKGCEKSPIVLKTNGRIVPLSGFPARMVEEVVRGMLSTLKGADANGEITLEISHKV